MKKPSQISKTDYKKFLAEVHNILSDHSQCAEMYHMDKSEPYRTFLKTAQKHDLLETFKPLIMGYTDREEIYNEIVGNQK